MLGPVFHQEMLLGSRRSKLHVFRWFYGGWLVLQVGYYWLVALSISNAQGMADFSSVDGGEASVVGGLFTETFVLQQMLFAVLATPAFVAGAVTDEKRRGTLQYLLCTNLDARHIILGKLFGRLAQVGLVALAGLPLFGLFAALGGTPPLTMLAAFVVLLPIVIRDQVVTPAKDAIPRIAEYYAFVQEIMFGALIIVFIIWEPDGLYRLWTRVRNAFQRWPFSY